MIITFCGHAHFIRTREHEKRLLAFLEQIVGDQPAEMYLGGYGGFDDFAYSVCKDYKKTHPKIALVFVTPYLITDRDGDLSQRSRASYDAILYPEIENKPKRLAILYRNRYMVEKADYVVAYVSHTWGGAYQAYGYAKRKKKTIFNLAESDE